MIFQETLMGASERKTVGAAAVELMSQGDQRQSVIETQREMTKEYIEELIKCAQDGAKKYSHGNPFYICVQTRRERLLTNVIRSQFYHRQTRPSPEYDLALYHYDPKAEQLSFVWNIPDKETVEMMSQPGYMPPADQQQLYYFVKCFLSCTLV